MKTNTIVLTLLAGLAPTAFADNHNNTGMSHTGAQAETTHLNTTQSSATRSSTQLNTQLNNQSNDQTISGRMNMNDGERGLTRDHEATKAACGVGNYIFRSGEQNCNRTATVVEDTVQATSAATETEMKPIEREKTVYFDTNESRIATDEREEVRDAIEYLRANRDAKVEVRGYADATGTIRYNQRLANRRAMALKEHLVTSNISRDQVVVVTPEKPVSDTPNNQEDRKVELRLIQLAE